MFRPMLRQKQQLSREECIRLLTEEKRGVLSVLGDGEYPYGMPMNHLYCEQDGRLYFHSGKMGHRADALARCDKASFCVFDGGFRREGEWALNVRSVIAFGRIERIEEPERAIEIARLLSRKFTDDEGYIQAEIDRFAAATLVFALNIEHMTGKLVNES